MSESNTKRAGRPRKHSDAQTKIKAWRAKQTGHRLDGYVDSKAHWRLKALAKAWECSLAGAVERLAVEADNKYSDILFPDEE